MPVCGVACVNFSTSTRPDSAKAAATLPLAAGDLGLRSAERLRHAAHWASWADMLEALSSVAANFIAALEAGEGTPSIQSSSQLHRQPCWSWFRGACMGSCGCQLT